MPSSSERPDQEIIGQSLLPPGAELGAYVKDLADIIFQEIRSSGFDCPVAEENIVHLTNEVLNRMGWRAQHIRKAGAIRLENFYTARQQIDVIGLDDGTVVGLAGEMSWPSIYAMATEDLRKMQENFQEDNSHSFKFRENPYARPLKWEERKTSAIDGVMVNSIITRIPDLIDRVSAEVSSLHLAAVSQPAPAIPSRSHRL